MMIHLLFASCMKKMFVIISVHLVGCGKYFIVGFFSDCLWISVAAFIGLTYICMQVCGVQDSTVATALLKGSD